MRLAVSGTAFSRAFFPEELGNPSPASGSKGNSEIRSFPKKCPCRLRGFPPTLFHSKWVVRNSGHPREHNSMARKPIYGHHKATGQARSTANASLWALTGHRHQFAGSTRFWSSGKQRAPLVQQFLLRNCPSVALPCCSLSMRKRSTAGTCPGLAWESRPKNALHKTGPPVGERIYPILRWKNSR